MATKETFAQILRTVCGDQRWELLPSGVNVNLTAGRHQVINLEFFEFRGVDLVRLITMIGGAKALSREHLDQALRANVGLPHGALALRGNDLCMTETLSLEDADPGEIESSISFLAETADYYERILFGTDEH